jgi:hypothetical protein
VHVNLSAPNHIKGALAANTIAQLRKQMETNEVVFPISLPKQIKTSRCITEKRECVFGLGNMLIITIHGRERKQEMEY